jgi:hypothetical protein
MPAAVTFIPRDEFLSDYWDYRPGEHVSLIEKTQGGKTHLGYQLLGKAMEQNPHLEIVSLMPKPNSPATARWADELGLKETPVWPPAAPWPWDKPRGYVMWPKHRKDLPADENRKQVAGKLRKALARQYWRGKSIVFADDVYVIAVLMGLNPECEEYWTAGSEGGAALWTANQKPSGTIGGGSVSSFSYNAPTHLFLGWDNDERNIKRFGEIGGVDPKAVENIVRNLRVHQIGDKAISEKLYICKRGGPYMSVIGV